MQKVFWTQGAKVSEKSFAPPKTAFAPVQNGVAPVQEALCSLGPKDLLHPPLSTFGNFPFRSISQARSFPRLVQKSAKSLTDGQKRAGTDVRQKCDTLATKRTHCRKQANKKVKKCKNDRGAHPRSFLGHFHMYGQKRKVGHYLTVRELNE